MTDERDPADRPVNAPPPHVVRDVDGKLVPGSQPAGHPQVVERSAAAAMPTTPFTPDPAIAGGQMPVQPGEGPKQALDPNQPVYANPQMSAAWANRRPPSEKERLEAEMNEGVDEDPRVAGADNAPNPGVVNAEPVHEAPPQEGEHAQETDEARRLREEHERAEEERRQQEQQHQNPPQP